MKGVISNCEHITVGHGVSFKHAITKINEAKSGVALIVDKDFRLVGVVTDGDIRRSILKGVRLEDNVTRAMTRNPVTMKASETKGEVFRKMTERNVTHIPIVDKGNRLLGIVYEESLRRENLLTSPVVIMAGGLGTRLRPLTKKIPKPMLKINGKPMLEHLIKRFRDLGAVDFYISINYMGHIIENHLGDGSALRVNIHYLREKKRLGTAGSLSLLPSDVPCPFFVINADVLTDLDFRAIYGFHMESRFDMTLAVKEISYQFPYGTVEAEHRRVIGLSEKPHIKKYVNAGIYVLDPRVLQKIPFNGFFDMTDLISGLLDTGRPVGSYLINGDWIDVGQKKDYHRANGQPTYEEEGQAIEDREQALDPAHMQYGLSAM